MRLLLAALLAYVATMVSIGLIPEKLMPWAMIVVMPLAVFVAFALFDRGFLRRLVNSDEQIVQKELEKGRARRRHTRLPGHCRSRTCARVAWCISSNSATGP